MFAILTYYGNKSHINLPISGNILPEVSPSPTPADNFAYKIDVIITTTLKMWKLRNRNIWGTYSKAIYKSK
jgi:hypothetical protein